MRSERNAEGDPAANSCNRDSVCLNYHLQIRQSYDSWWVPDSWRKRRYSVGLCCWWFFL